MIRVAELTDVARKYLPTDEAEKYLSLLRPAIRLDPHGGREVPVAARLGGLPRLPADVVWPMGGHGDPLWFAASVDCAVVASTGTLDISLPSEGTLLFFHDPVAWVETDAAVVYVPPGTAAEERAVPHGVEPYRVLDLRAVLYATEPGMDNPLLFKGWGVAEERREEALDPVLAQIATRRDFWAAVHRLDGQPDPRHWIGGWAKSIHFPVEYSAEAFARNAAWEDVVNKDTDWILLAQFDIEAVDQGKEHGVAYWLMKPDDLAAMRFAKAVSTIQPH